MPMDLKRQEAYRHLLYTVLLHLRAGRRRPVWWNPFSWWHAAFDLYLCRDLADSFHNLALFSIRDFERFDEKRFWQGIEFLGKEHGPEFVERYRRIFDAYVAGTAAYTC